MTIKEMLLHQSAKLGQQRIELKALQQTPGLALSANHELGVIMYSLATAENRLIALAGKGWVS